MLLFFLFVVDLARSAIGVTERRSIDGAPSTILQFFHAKRRPSVRHASPCCCFQYVERALRTYYVCVGIRILYSRAGARRFLYVTIHGRPTMVVRGGWPAAPERGRRPRRAHANGGWRSLPRAAHARMLRSKGGTYWLVVKVKGLPSRDCFLWGR